MKSKNNATKSIFILLIIFAFSAIGVILGLASNVIVEIFAGTFIGFAALLVMHVFFLKSLTVTKGKELAKFTLLLPFQTFGLWSINSIVVGGIHIFILFVTSFNRPIAAPAEGMLSLIIPNIGNFIQSEIHALVTIGLTLFLMARYAKMTRTQKSTFWKVYVIILGVLSAMSLLLLLALASA